MRKAVLTFCLMLLAPLAFCQGQVAPERPAKRIVTRTRLVTILSELENQLFQALRGKKPQAVSELLSEDFQLWSPAAPGDPVPRDEWLKQATAENLTDFELRQLAARSVNDDVVLLHFVLTKKVQAAGKSLAAGYFVVDLWQNKGGQWQLSDRYASPLGRVKPGPRQPSGKN